jgi:hypothetical protein
LLQGPSLQLESHVLCQSLDRSVIARDIRLSVSNSCWGQKSIIYVPCEALLLPTATTNVHLQLVGETIRMLSLAAL